MAYRVVEVIQLLEVAAIHGGNRLSDFAVGGRVRRGNPVICPHMGTWRDVTAHAEGKNELTRFYHSGNATFIEAIAWRRRSLIFCCCSGLSNL